MIEPLARSAKGMEYLRDGNSAVGVASLLSFASLLTAPSVLPAKDRENTPPIPDGNKTSLSLGTSWSNPEDFHFGSATTFSASDSCGLSTCSKDELNKFLKPRERDLLFPDEISVSLRIVHPVVHLDQLGIKIPKALEAIGNAIDPSAATNGGAGDLAVPMPAVDFGYYIGDHTVMNLRFAYVETDYTASAVALGGLVNVRYRFAGSAASFGVGFQHFLRAIDSEKFNIGIDARAEVYYGDLYVKVGFPVMDEFEWRGLGYGASVGLVARVPLGAILKPVFDQETVLQLNAACEFAKVGFAELDGSPNLSIALVMPIR